MRERLIAALVGMTVAVVALYGLPRAYQLADLVQAQETRKIERSVELLSVLVAERMADAEPVTTDYLAELLHEAEHVEYVAPDGTRVVAGEPPEGNGSDIAITREVAGGGTITLARSGELVDQRISDALLPLVLIGLLLVVAAGVLGFWLAGRLSRPFSELATTADQLGRGRFDVEVPHYPVPEAERIGQALRVAAEELDGLLRREREFAVNASHQLRTPITALRLELEDLSMWPETPPAVATHLTASLAELDRLGAAIGELLDLARGHRLGATRPLDLAAVAAEGVRQWQDRFAALGRPIVDGSAGPVTARAPAGPVRQVLDVLLENAADHGTGTVTVDAADVGTHVQLRVADEGTPGLGPQVFGRGVTGSTRGTGVGLAVAAELAEAMGGYLSLDEDVGHACFLLRLPLPSPAPHGGPDAGDP